MESLCITADRRMYDVKHDSQGSREQQIARTARAGSRTEPHSRTGFQVVD
jgi:hypothetical protein